MEILDYLPLDQKTHNRTISQPQNVNKLTTMIQVEIYRQPQNANKLTTMIQVEILSSDIPQRKTSTLPQKQHVPRQTDSHRMLGY